MRAFSPEPRILPRPLLAGHGSGIELLDHDAVPGLPGGGGAPGSMLLLHGFGGDKAQLRPVGDALCPQGSVAVYPSLRAHGASHRPAWGYSVLDFAADLHRFGDALPGDLHLVGYSYGGLVAAVSAVTWGASRVRSLVVVDQSFDAHPDLHVADEWAEGSLLRWTYDFGHLPDLLERLGIPVLVLAAAGSRNILADEQERLSRRDSASLRLEIIHGSHADCYRNTGEITSAMRVFYRDHFSAVRKEQENS
ncbi:alpha/beta fold hydrolase [Streptomyces sp. TLI_185]|uniref:alpha/beta fold hydrolase n=1 Tax=Streptomyces sp. TLI_185 TaxID=2485151 RepID=UPI000F4FECBC|nr:alpha/beta fold hydrolase [Streptomyces sp. TLI_185]RPF35131.1 alpha/beta hydrolase family protein [Streptomyces sp. TLI_185]